MRLHFQRAVVGAAVLVLGIGGYGAAAQTTVAQAIKRAEQLDTRCRDGGESWEATERICNQREALIGDLKAMGWCFGRPDQAQYQKKWQPCDDPMSRLLATIPWPQGHVPKWRKVEADNGAVFMVQTNSIRRGADGAAEVFVYAVQGERYDPRLMRLYMFDCRGSYQTNDNYRVRYAPPKSVAGVIAGIACEGGG